MSAMRPGEKHTLASQVTVSYLALPAAPRSPHSEQVASSNHHRTRVAIVVVEHKMKFISDLADRVVVLNFGRKIAEDTHDNVRTHGQAIDAYLGTRTAAQA